MLSPYSFGICKSVKKKQAHKNEFKSWEQVKKQFGRTQKTKIIDTSMLHQILFLCHANTKSGTITINHNS